RRCPVRPSEIRIAESNRSATIEWTVQTCDRECFRLASDIVPRVLKAHARSLHTPLVGFEGGRKSDWRQAGQSNCTRRYTATLVDELVSKAVGHRVLLRFVNLHDHILLFLCRDLPPRIHFGPIEDAYGVQATFGCQNVTFCQRLLNLQPSHLFSNQLGLRDVVSYCNNAAGFDLRAFVNRVNNFEFVGLVGQRLRCWLKTRGEVAVLEVIRHDFVPIIIDRLLCVRLIWSYLQPIGCELVYLNRSVSFDANRGDGILRTFIDDELD